jgi:hypothetical protein
LSGVFRDVFVNIFRDLPDLPTLIALSHTCVELYALSLDDTIWRFYYAHWGKTLKRPFPLLKGYKENSVWKWRVLFQNYLCILLKGNSRKQCDGFYIALYNFVGADKNELSFKEGDILAVLERDDSGWWTGLNFNATAERRAEGWFPGTYVEEYFQHTTSAAHYVSLHDAKYRALYAYEAADASELSFTVNDIFIGKYDCDGWFDVVNQAGRRGYVPGNYLKKVK